MNLGRIKIKAIVIALFFIGTMIVPINAVHYEEKEQSMQITRFDSSLIEIK